MLVVRGMKIHFVVKFLYFYIFFFYDFRYLELYFTAANMKHFDASFSAALHVFGCIDEKSAISVTVRQDFLPLTFLSRQGAKFSLDSVRKVLKIKNVTYKLSFMVGYTKYGNIGHFYTVAPLHDIYVKYDCLQKNVNILDKSEKICLQLALYVKVTQIDE
jgi:hypothetical protein